MAKCKAMQALEAQCQGQKKTLKQLQNDMVANLRLMEENQRATEEGFAQMMEAICTPSPVFPMTMRFPMTILTMNFSGH